MKALILAAGQGTRLRLLTRERPKPILPIRGKPLLQHTILWLRSYGITDIAINLHHRPLAITQHLGNGEKFGVSIHYSHEDKLMGTAGAAKRLEPFLDEPFAVIYGDVLTNLDLNRLIHLHNLSQRRGHARAALTMALYAVPDPTQCGLVEIDKTGRVMRFVEKPPADQVFTDRAFAGIMVCDPAILSHIPADVVYDFGHDLIPALMAGNVAIYGQTILASEHVIDIGTLPGYLKAMQMCASGNDNVSNDNIDRDQLVRV